MPDTYFIRIKKSYAADLIEDLKKMDAVEFIDEENITIPQWQIDKVREAKNRVEEDETSLVDWKTVKENISKK